MDRKNTISGSDYETKLSSFIEVILFCYLLQRSVLCSSMSGNTWCVTAQNKAFDANIDRDFQVWYKQILGLAEKLGIVEAIPRKTSIQRNHSNIPSCRPIDHYKKSVAFPLLDSLIIQMQDRFSDEDRHARHLLYLIPSIIVNNTLELSEATEGMFF